MEKTNLSRLLAGISILGAVQADAQTVFTTDNLDLRKDATFIRPNPTGPNKGGTSFGDLVVQPGFDPTAVANSPTMDLLLRWEGIDLDGVGGNDDYFDFTVRVTSNVDSVYFTSVGFGVTPTWGLDPGEELTYEVVSIKLKDGIAGAVSFDGFSEAAFFAAANAGAGLPTSADMNADINGNPVSVDLVGTGYTNGISRTSFPLASTLLFDNVSETVGSADPDGWARDYDIQFTYDENGTPPPPPPVTVTSTGTNLRSDTVYPTVGGPNQGGASIGNIIPNPDATYPGSASPTTSYFLRWTDVDLDDDGDFDDYFNFTVRVTNLVDNGENVTIGNQGIGVKGSGSGGLPANDNLNTGDELMVEVVNVQVSPGIQGSVTFDGFSASALGAGVGATGGTVSVACDINGLPVFVDLPDSASFQYGTDKATFGSLASTVVFNNVVETADLKNPSGRIREMDMQFTWDATTPPPPLTLTASALDLRPNATYIYPTGAEPFNQGGTNLGDLVTPAGFDPTATTAAPVMDFPLRWEGLDLDNTGVADDYIEFTLRASSGTVDNVSFGGEGMGVSGYLETGEALTLEVVDIQLSAGTPGQVSFDGFFGGSFSGIGNAGAELSTTGSIDADINGNTVMVDLDGTGYTNVSKSSTFPLTSSLLFDNIVQTAGTVTPTGRARNYSLQFNYSQVVASSDPRISDVSFDSGPRTLTLTTVDVVDGQTYHAAYSPDLVTPFAPVSGSNETAAAGQVVHMISVGAPTKGFYRVVEGSTP